MFYSDQHCLFPNHVRGRKKWTFFGKKWFFSGWDILTIAKLSQAWLIGVETEFIVNSQGLNSCVQANHHTVHLHKAKSYCCYSSSMTYIIHSLDFGLWGTKKIFLPSFPPQPCHLRISAVYYCHKTRTWS